jgi:membrane protein YdbS with pleckstrin-like domain
MATPPDNTRGGLGSNVRRIGGKKMALTVVAVVILLPIALITLGVVAVPVVSIPAALVVALAVILYMTGRPKQHRHGGKRHPPPG